MTKPTERERKRIQEAFETSAALDLLQKPWKARPEDVKPTTKAHAMSSLDREMAHLTELQVRKSLGGSSLRRSGHDRIWKGGVARTKTVLWSDPLRDLGAHPKVLDQWHREHGIHASTAHGPAYERTVGLPEEFAARLEAEVQFGLPHTHHPSWRREFPASESVLKFRVPKDDTVTTMGLEKWREQHASKNTLKSMVKATMPPQLFPPNAASIPIQPPGSRGGWNLAGLDSLMTPKSTPKASARPMSTHGGLPSLNETVTFHSRLDTDPVRTQYSTS